MTGTGKARLARLLCLALATAPAAADEGHLAPDRVRERVAALQPAVEEALGVELAPFEVRVVTKEELREATEAELRRQYARIEDAAARAGAEAGAADEAALFSRIALAKVVTESRTLLVCVENFRCLSELAPEYAPIREPPFLDMILLHELVHVAQFQRLGAGPMLEACRRPEQLHVAAAVVEGHAQHVARRLAAARGLAEQFDLLVESNTRAPSAVDDPAMRELLESQAVAFAFSYVEGEKFVAAVAERLGEREATRQIFAEPPGRLRMVADPRLYLDPTLDRPAAIDLERWQGILLRLWEERFGGGRAVPLTRPVLQAGFAALGPERAARVAARIRDGFAIAHASGTVGVLLCEDADAAGEIQDAQVALLKRRDELFGREGSPMRIVDASYRDVDWIGERTLAFRKHVRVEAAGATVATDGATGVRGNVVLECTLIGSAGGSFLVERIAWEVTTLLDGLEQPAPWSGKRDDEARAAVLGALDHDDPRLRWRAVRNVMRMDVPDERKREALLPRLEDADGRVRAAALRGLLHAGWADSAEAAAPAALVRDPDPEVGPLVLGSLSRWKALGEDGALRLALEALESPRTEVLVAALGWIADGNHGDEIPGERYAALGAHADTLVRSGALRALHDVRSGVAPFRDTVLRALRDDDAGCRGQALLLLMLRDEDAWWSDAVADAVVDGMAGDGPLVRSTAWHAVERAPRRLIEARAGKLEALLAADLGNPALPALAETVLGVLGKFPWLLEPHREKVADLARDGRGGLRAEAVLALHAAGDRDDALAAALLDALEERMAEEGYRLAEALCEWDADRVPDRAVEVLVRSLGREDHPLLRLHAAEALGRLGSRAAGALPALDGVAGDQDLVRRAAEAAAKAIRADQADR